MEIYKLGKMDWMTDDGRWILLRDQSDKIYIFVCCEHCHASFNFLMQLGGWELDELRNLGWIFVQYLACRINSYTRDYQQRSIQGVDLEVAEKLYAEHDRLTRNNSNSGPSLECRINWPLNNHTV